MSNIMQSDLMQSNLMPATFHGTNADFPGLVLLDNLKFTRQKITKVTSKGSFYTNDATDRDYMFKVAKSWRVASGFDVVNKKGEVAYDDTPNNFQYLTEQLEKLEAEKQQEKTAAAEKRRLQEQKRLAQIAELREIFSLMTGLSQQMIIRPNDDTVVYTIQMPVKPNAEKTWQILSVKIEKVKLMSWDKSGKPYEMCASWTNNKTSFVTTSTDRFATQDDALWEAIRTSYHHW